MVYDRVRMENDLGQLEGGETPTTSVQKLRQRWAGCKVQVGGIRIGGSLVSRSCTVGPDCTVLGPDCTVLQDWSLEPDRCTPCPSLQSAAQMYVCTSLYF